MVGDHRMLGGERIEVSSAGGVRLARVSAGDGGREGGHGVGCGGRIGGLGERGRAEQRVDGVGVHGGEHGVAACATEREVKGAVSRSQRSFASRGCRRDRGDGVALGGGGTPGGHLHQWRLDDAPHLEQVAHRSGSRGGGASRAVGLGHPIGHHQPVAAPLDEAGDHQPLDGLAHGRAGDSELLAQGSFGGDGRARGQAPGADGLHEAPAHLGRHGVPGDRLEEGQFWSDGQTIATLGLTKQGGALVDARWVRGQYARGVPSDPASSSGAPPNVLRPPVARWTHIALPCTDIDATIAWYERYTPLRLLDRRVDEDGLGAWLGQPDMADKPFILVLVSFFRDQQSGPQPVMAPFAHIGIELTSEQEVDDIAARGEAEGSLAWAPRHMPPPIGYVCALKDPDGNLVEFSFDQGVYAKAHEVWGGSPS